jgi:hypothetical protein
MMQFNNQSNKSFGPTQARERPQKYLHPKGTPDADLIFGFYGTSVGGGGVGGAAQTQIQNSNQPNNKCF